MENASLPVATSVRTAGPCGMQLLLEGRAHLTLLNAEVFYAPTHSPSSIKRRARITATACYAGNLGPEFRQRLIEFMQAA